MNDRTRNAIGVLGALPEEVAAIGAMLGSQLPSCHGQREFIRGAIGQVPVVLTHSRIGKVAAASAAVELISRFQVARILFFGVAGALSPDLSPGDVVVAQRLVQHDLDASPLFPPLQIPLTRRSFIPADPPTSRALHAAAQAFLKDCPEARARGNRVVLGDIATGDQFIASAEARAALRARVPSALCVEMEGAAVAQVCAEYDTPFGVVRVISDDAGDEAPAHFLRSLDQIAGEYAAGIMRRFVSDS